ncbi:hypothetical protein [Microbacterium sp. CGR1]|uniref:hypothetical protein n=1 Tax=Microbacterium sp. CGR1 TaxID=1696072 RepID=UPI003DA50773
MPNVVCGVVVFARSDAEKLVELVALADRRVLTLEVTRRIPLTELPALHAEAAEGPISSRAIVIPWLRLRAWQALELDQAVGALLNR